MVTVHNNKNTCEILIVSLIELFLIFPDAYCPHLGANLAVGGRVVEDDIQCPFHLWTFSGQDGQCVDIPYAEMVRFCNRKILL